MFWVQAVGMAVVWETLSKGTRSWGADKATNLLCAFQLSQGWSWLCPLVSEDQGSWSMGAGQTALGKHPSASWALSQGRMAGVSKMCAHKSISVCVYEHRHKHMYMCVYIYIYMHLTLQVTWDTKTFWKPTWKDESKTKWLQTTQTPVNFYSWRRELDMAEHPVYLYWN